MYHYYFQGFTPHGEQEEGWSGEGPNAMAALNAAFGSKQNSINNFLEDVHWKYEFEVKGGTYTSFANSRKHKRIVAVLSRYPIKHGDNGTWVEM
jgi:hypothetical protein